MYLLPFLHSKLSTTKNLASFAYLIIIVIIYFARKKSKWNVTAAGNTRLWSIHYAQWTKKKFKQLISI